MHHPRPWTERSKHDGEWTKEWQAQVYTQTRGNIKAHFSVKRRRDKKLTRANAPSNELRQRLNGEEAALRQERMIRDIIRAKNSGFEKMIDDNVRSSTQSRRFKGKKRLSMVASANMIPEKIVSLVRRDGEMIRGTEDANVFKRLHASVLQKNEAVERFCEIDSIKLKRSKVSMMKRAEAKRRSGKRSRREIGKRVAGALNTFRKLRQAENTKRTNVLNHIERCERVLDLRELRQQLREDYGHRKKDLVAKRLERARTYQSEIDRLLEDSERRNLEDIQRKRQHVRITCDKRRSSSNATDTTLSPREDESDFVSVDRKEPCRHRKVVDTDYPYMKVNEISSSARDGIGAW